MFEHLTDNQAARAVTMKAASKGITAYQLAKACNALRPGMDFRWLGKKKLYDEFAEGELCLVHGQALRDAIRKVCLK
jgi:hypothetical protein